jgi:hypothetical protein
MSAALILSAFLCIIGLAAHLSTSSVKFRQRNTFPALQAAVQIATDFCLIATLYEIQGGTITVKDAKIYVKLSDKSQGVTCSL